MHKRISEIAPTAYVPPKKIFRDLPDAGILWRPKRAHIDTERVEKHKMRGLHNRGLGSPRAGGAK